MVPSSPELREKECDLMVPAFLPQNSDISHTSRHLYLSSQHHCKTNVKYISTTQRVVVSTQPPPPILV